MSQTAGALAPPRQALSEPTPLVHAYLRRSRRVLCHQAGPHCGGGGDEAATPLAAVHVRHGDSCDQVRREPGPFNSMWTSDEFGNATRVAGRYCYDFDAVYVPMLAELQRRYGRFVRLETMEDEKIDYTRLLRWLF